MAYENYTVREFEYAMFKEDRSVMTEDIYQTVYSEYVDTAKLYETEEFQKVAYITYLNNRINTITLELKLQRDFFEDFEIPYIEGFKVFKRNGYSIKWKDNPEEFLKALNCIELGEKKYMSEVENCIKQLQEFRAKKVTGDQPVKIKRESWIRTIISLGKLGYKIDKDKESVEDLSLMIRQQTEENKT